MGTTAEKLTYLNDTKQLLKENINNLGGNLTTEPFRQYASVLEGIYERLPKISGIGASLSLSPSLMGKIKLNEIQGNTLQNGTPTPSSPVPIESVTGLQNVKVCGKNLFKMPVDIIAGNGSGITATYNSDGSITFNGTSSGGVMAFRSRIITSNYHTLSYTSNKTSNNVIVRTREYSDNLADFTTIQDGLNATETSKSVTSNKSIGCVEIDIASGTTLSDFNIKVQLEYGETKTSFEQYNSNTYEVNLGNIELNKIGDYKDSFKKSTGKNLVYEIEQGSFNYQTGAFSTNANIIRTKKIPVKPNTTYTISSKLVLGECCTYFYENDGTTRIAGSLLISTTTVKSISFTTPNNAYYMIFRLGASSVPYTYTDDNNIMLNEGSTALPYEPYGKVWYVENNTRKIVLNGSETPSQVNTSSTNTTRVSYNHYADGSTGLGLILCNILSYANNWNTDVEGISYDENNGGFWFRINKSTIGTTQTEVQNWLSSHNLISYIALATPIYEVITNTELIEQLESLNNAKSEDGTTNINVTSEDLSMILNVGVLKGE